MPQKKSFIEVQFPVSKVSKESYKERKANLGQTLTGIGKWWGRKPLILVRAAILGLLMPASNDMKRDREIFLKILTMDKTGLLKRKSKPVPAKEAAEFLSYREQLQYFDVLNGEPVAKYRKGMTVVEKEALQEKVFNRMSYDQKLVYCVRPEEYDNQDARDWKEINAHLGTNASNLQELIGELGKQKFGRRATVGDCFCGGGSIPFEAVRMGCDAYASDLNPIAGLLTWADLHIAGASEAEVEKLREFQQKVYDSVDQQVKAWGIDSNEAGDRANSYLYCSETICPECGHKLPLSPSWVIGKGTKTVALLKDNGKDGFDIDIKSGVSDQELKAVDEMATVKNGGIYCPHCKRSTPISSLRKDRRKAGGELEYGLRKWQKDEFIPRETDTFQERLYCIRYVQEYMDERGNIKTERYYVAPNSDDIKREQKVIALLSERIKEWQEKGYLPNSEIEEGDKTDEPIRTRGWKYWHQLFNPRQLLTHGLFMLNIEEMAKTDKEKLIGLLGINKFCNWNSKLSRWHPRNGVEKVVDTYSNQALNTVFDFGTRAFCDLVNLWFFNINNYPINVKSEITIDDARNVSSNADYWITDPPYADAVNYHELSEFFLVWDKKMLKKVFRDWYADSKRVLAVSGRDKTFNNSMIEIYSNLAENMPDNGMQIIMFT
ncbi:MAG: DUF1156 domain-containing protein, partial [Bacillota bacterium]